MSVVKATVEGGLSVRLIDQINQHSGLFASLLSPTPPSSTMDSGELLSEILAVS